MHVRKRNPGGDSFGHQWVNGGDVVEVDNEHAAELVRVDPDEFEASVEPFGEAPAIDPPAVELADAKTAADVLAWVGTDPVRARQALDAEQSADKPRITLVAQLTKVANTVEE